MQVGIIVFSKTGNTLSVAQRLQERLLADGHSAVLKRVVPEMSKGSAVMGKLAENPDTEGYDVLIFAAPVWGFTVSHVMKTYLNGLSSLKGRKTGLFVTQSFRKPWLGGNRALRRMHQICTEKGAVVYRSGVINWSCKERERQIADLVSKLGAMVDTQENRKRLP